MIKNILLVVFLAALFVLLIRAVRKNKSTATTSTDSTDALETPLRFRQSQFGRKDLFTSFLMRSSPETHEVAADRHPNIWLWLLVSQIFLFIIISLIASIETSFTVTTFVSFIAAAILLLTRRRKRYYSGWTAIEGVTYNRWGPYIYDPDVSRFSYAELRQSDPTLPKIDPRATDVLDDGVQIGMMDPSRKWLYFSTEYGSYKKRCELYYGYGKHDSRRQALLRRLDPNRLTNEERNVLMNNKAESNRRRIQSSKCFNHFELAERLPRNTAALLSSPSSLVAILRYSIGRIIHSDQFAGLVYLVFVFGILGLVMHEDLIDTYQGWSEGLRSTFCIATASVFFALMITGLILRSRLMNEGDDIVGYVLNTIMLAMSATFLVSLILFLFMGFVASLVSLLGWYMLYLPTLVLVGLVLLYLIGGRDRR